MLYIVKYKLNGDRNVELMKGVTSTCVRRQLVDLHPIDDVEILEIDEVY
jgi:hypothetical protein